MTRLAAAGSSGLLQTIGELTCSIIAGTSHPKNGIAKRCHHMVKCIVARMRHPIMEAVYWYNVTTRDSMLPPTALAKKIYHHNMRVKGVDTGVGRSQDRIPRHMKDLRTQHSVTLLEEDSDGTHESEAESLLCDNSPEEGAEAEPPSMPLCRSIC